MITIVWKCSNLHKLTNKALIMLLHSINLSQSLSVRRLDNSTASNKQRNLLLKSVLSRLITGTSPKQPYALNSLNQPQNYISPRWRQSSKLKMSARVFKISTGKQNLKISLKCPYITDLQEKRDSHSKLIANKWKNGYLIKEGKKKQSIESIQSIREINTALNFRRLAHQKEWHSVSLRNTIRREIVFTF